MRHFSPRLDCEAIICFAIDSVSPRAPVILRIWVCCEQATTMTLSHNSWPLVSYNSAISTNNHTLDWRACAASEAHCERTFGWRIEFNFLRFSSVPNAALLSAFRSILPDSSKTGSPKALWISFLTSASFSRSSLAAKSASNQTVRSISSLLLSRPMQLDFPVAIPPVIPKTGMGGEGLVAEPEVLGGKRRDFLGGLGFGMGGFNRLACGVNDSRRHKDREVLFDLLIDVRPE